MGREPGLRNHPGRPIGNALEGYGGRGHVCLMTFAQTVGQRAAAWLDRHRAGAASGPVGKTWQRRVGWGKETQ